MADDDKWDPPSQVLSEGGPANTRLTLTENSWQTFGLSDKDADSRYARYIAEIARTTIGPMPVDEFLETFMDCSRIMREYPDMPPTKGAFASIPEGAKEEESIYEPMIKALNSSPERCPKYTFYNTSKHPDDVHGRTGSMKPDICCYSDDESKGSSIIINDWDYTAQAEMGMAAFFIEVKRSVGQDFFSDPPEWCSNFQRDHHAFVLPTIGVTVPNQKAARRAIGQNASYASEILVRQHRHSCFSVSMSGSHVRLMRWDRAGAVVTQSFDIRTDPRPLCQFLWCFSHLTDDSRGYDQTIRAATLNENLTYRSAIRTHVKKQLGSGCSEGQIDRAIQEHADYKVVSCILLRTSEGKIRRLLVSRPLVYPLSVAGRSTRGYWAVDPETEELVVVFLKDTWRYGWKDPEGVTLRVLQAKGVANIPGVWEEGDVPHFVGVESVNLDAPIQTTRTQQFLTKSWVCGRDTRSIAIVKRTHYRLVLDIAGYTLLDFKGTSELLHTTYDVFIALSDAYTKANLLHRDVTPRNIILYRKSETSDRRIGYLVDWDLSMPVDADYECEEVYSATWQFLSAEVANGKIGHVIQDDMESLLYCTLWCSMLFLPHNLNQSGTFHRVTALFDTCAFNVQETVGTGLIGDAKMSNRRMRRYTGTIKWASTHLHTWLNEMMHYMAVPLKHTATPAAARYADKWNVPEIKKFWGGFLRTFLLELPDNDRVNNLGNLLQEKGTLMIARHRAYCATAVRGGPKPERPSEKRRRTESLRRSEQSPSRKKTRLHVDVSPVSQRPQSPSIPTTRLESGASMMSDSPNPLPPPSRAIEASAGIRTALMGSRPSLAASTRDYTMATVSAGRSVDVHMRTRTTLATRVLHTIHKRDSPFQTRKRSGSSGHATIGRPPSPAGPSSARTATARGGGSSRPLSPEQTRSTSVTPTSRNYVMRLGGRIVTPSGRGTGGASNAASQTSRKGKGRARD